MAIPSLECAVQKCADSRAGPGISRFRNGAESGGYEYKGLGKLATLPSHSMEGCEPRGVDEHFILLLLLLLLIGYSGIRERLSRAACRRFVLDQHVDPRRHR